MNIYAEYLALDKELKEIEWKIYESRDNLYCDTIISFDIETTSLFYKLDNFCENGEWEGYNANNAELYADYASLCYCWSVAIGNKEEEIYRFFGRTLESFKEFLYDIEVLTPDVYKFIYVHNLKYEFQFLRNIFAGMQVFAREVRTPIYVVWENYEFRCSYLLTNLSLANWAKTKNFMHQKLAGSLDYYKSRTPYTIMNDEEINYSLEDSVIVVEGIREYLNEYKHIKNIPLTQTGRVRKEVQNLMLKEYEWHRKMKGAYCNNIIEYKEHTSVFWGGLTRANRLHAGLILKDVSTRDATSAYPWQMLSKQYPVTDFAKTSNYEYIKNNPDFCFYLTVEFYKLKSRYWNSYIPTDKCISVKNAMLDNGRIIEADYVKIRVLDIDYNIIKRSYYIDKEEIIDMHYALKGYLNQEFLRYIVKLFNEKTRYKGVEGKEELYQRSKEMLNSMYGMMVTREFNNEILFTDDWIVKELTLDSFNKKLDDILSKQYKLNYTFMMGAYVTAYQRESLWSFVESFDELIVYMDTDSHKYIMTDDTEYWYIDYNSDIEIEQFKVAERLGISINELNPISPTGEISSIGKYIPEQSYAEFKTLGAKRYAYKYDCDNECHCTISGVNKHSGGLALQGDLNNFKNGFVFENEYCKKLTMHYLDNQSEVVYNKGRADEFVSNYKYGIASEPATYTLDLHSYKDTLLDVMSKRDTFTFKQLDKAVVEFEASQQK